MNADWSGYKNALAFCPINFHPSEQAIKLFRDYTEKGTKPPIESETVYDEFAELLRGQALWSGLQETMWLEGHFDGSYSLILVIIDYLEAGKGDPVYWERNERGYQKAVNLLLVLRGGLPAKTSPIS